MKKIPPIRDDQLDEYSPHWFDSRPAQNEDHPGRRKIKKFRSKRRAGLMRKRIQREASWH